VCTLFSFRLSLVVISAIFSMYCGPKDDFDVLILNGTIYDGSGGEPFSADLGIRGDTIAAIGGLDEYTSRIRIDAEGRAVSPGFINMLSWAHKSLLFDGQSQSNIRQGVTLEVMGEGWSMGPMTPAMRQEMIDDQRDYTFEVPWTTLGEYLQHLEDIGVSTNVTSFVGATTVRIHELGHENRPPSNIELKRMQDLVRQAMEEGAVGVSSALAYAPADYASTEELIALAAAAAEYDGMYISHIRDESDTIFEALDEFFRICREARIRGEIYHLKTAFRQNYHKLGEVFRRIEAAQAEGLAITANIYTYNAGSTGLEINFPTWVQEGGHDAWVKRLKDPEIRERMKTEMHLSPPEDILLAGFRNKALQSLTGKTLAEVAEMRGTSPEETAMDLVIEDGSRVVTVIFQMSEENVHRKVAKPWIAFGSDGESLTITEPFTNYQPHPRTYGTFARLLGKYVHEEGIITLPEAIRRLTAFPAHNLRIRKRGQLKIGYYADVVVFDPATITDHATYEEPHQYATGVEQVFVNGVQVIKDGDHTGNTPGRYIKGPGWKGAK